MRTATPPPKETPPESPAPHPLRSPAAPGSDTPSEASHAIYVSEFEVKISPQTSELELEQRGTHARRRHSCPMPASRLLELPRQPMVQLRRRWVDARLLDEAGTSEHTAAPRLKASGVQHETPDHSEHLLYRRGGDAHFVRIEGSGELDGDGADRRERSGRDFIGIPELGRCRQQASCLPAATCHGFADRQRSLCHTGGNEGSARTHSGGDAQHPGKCGDGPIDARSSPERAAEHAPQHALVDCRGSSLCEVPRAASRSLVSCGSASGGRVPI